MRHALIRFLTALDVDAAWYVALSAVNGAMFPAFRHFPVPNAFFTTTRYRYVPNPSPSVFRTTKNNHNILQGVSAPDLRLTQGAKSNFDAWILKNGLRWTAEGGPLAPGGVDIAFIGMSLYC
jgi:hypothetical protein